jgi:ribulose-phosphate 3-epimerase
MAAVKAPAWAPAVLSPSLLAADFCDLGGALRFAEQSGAAMVHLDVMDGLFVPQLSIGQPVVKSVRRATTLPLDVHLMVEKPEVQVASFAAAGADVITFHWEAAVHHHRILEAIHALGKQAGIAICPSTPVAALQEVLPEVDVVLVMTVDPGFGGQALLAKCLKKVAELADIQRKTQAGFRISVDGGVDQHNLASVISAGANIIVSGSAFFSNALEVVG